MFWKIEQRKSDVIDGGLRVARVCDVGKRQKHENILQHMFGSDRASCAGVCEIPISEFVCFISFTF